MFATSSPGVQVGCGLNRLSSPKLLACTAALVLTAAAADSPPPASLAGMRATQDAASGQIDLFEGSQPILRYNYRTIEPGALLSQVSEPNRIYARARSDYIHPLYGLGGEVLTRDWPVDHPHHRGIYWAWPEVDFGTARGDLHALQKVFARPTGRLALKSGGASAQVEAESLWQWEDREPIVREVALIMAYPATSQGRAVDLVFRFEALQDGVTVARRETKLYGGLNVRLATPASQTINTHTDPADAAPRRAWSDLSGVFAGGAASGLTVLQSPSNPDYPGDWVKYPELSWCQPTFPKAETRFALPKGQPLVLRYRLWIHRGGQPADDEAARLWDTFKPDAANPPAFTFTDSPPSNPALK